MRACGPDIFGSGRAFIVEVFVSPGGYICGEQSALHGSDGRSAGLNFTKSAARVGNQRPAHDRPTLVNNVETMASTPAILLRHDAEEEESTRKTLQQELTVAAENKLANAVDDKAKERAARELKDASTEAAAGLPSALRGMPPRAGRAFVAGDCSRSPATSNVPAFTKCRSARRSVS